MSAQPAIKPCPFCGETEEVYPAYRTRRDPDGMIRCVGRPYAIDCVGCGFEFVPREGMDTVAMWNRRTP